MKMTPKSGRTPSVQTEEPKKAEKRCHDASKPPKNPEDQTYYKNLVGLNQQYLGSEKKGRYLKAFDDTFKDRLNIHSNFNSNLRRPSELMDESYPINNYEVLNKKYEKSILTQICGVFIILITVVSCAIVVMAKTGNLDDWLGPRYIFVLAQGTL
jgi:hypothetical protein